MAKSTHKAIINLGVLLGYLPDDCQGVCHAMTLRWLEACFLKQEHQFVERIDKITHEDDLIVNMQAMQEKLRKQEALHESEAAYFDMLGFYESLVLYQSPYQYRSLFNRYMQQVHLQQVSAFANSDQIAEQGGLKVIFSFAYLYNLKRVKNYLCNLKKIFNSFPTIPIIGMTLANIHHEIGLVYDTKNSIWSIMDINNWPFYQSTQEENIAIRILKSLKSDETMSAIINTSFILLNQAYLKDTEYRLVARLEYLRNQYQITKKITKNCDYPLLANLAAFYGDVHLIDKLGHSGYDFNVASYEYETPAYVATQNGHSTTIACLSKYHTNFEMILESGATLAYVAAQNGYENVIAELGKQGVNFNVQLDDWDAPIVIATKNGHAAVIAELSKYGANVNIPSSEGEPPIFIAAKNGDVKTVAELIKTGANIHATNHHGTSAIFIAAQNGHLKVIQALLKHGDDAEKLHAAGASPLFIAAQNGHFAVVKLLIRYSWEPYTPFVSTADRLRRFASARGDVIARNMNKYIATQRDPQYIILSPKKIADIMGHRHIACLLARHKVKRATISDRNQQNIQPRPLFCSPISTFFSSKVVAGKHAHHRKKNRLVPHIL